MNATPSELLYKFRKCDINALRIFTGKELYFAAPKDLNDPLDCQLPILALLDQVIASEAAGNSRDLLLKLRDLKVTNRANGGVELMHQAFESLSARSGVLSLSRNPTDALLWSHYADGHRGFCIGFDPSYFAGLIANWRQNGVLGASNVSYVDAPPYRDLFLQKAKDIEAIRGMAGEVREAAILEFRESYRRDAIVTNLTTKSKDWAYEREYRAVRAEPGTVVFPPLALREIVFGLRLSESGQLMIRTLLDGPEWNHIRFRRPVSTAGTFELELVDFQN
jgi:hypothetical protein